MHLVYGTCVQLSSLGTPTNTCMLHYFSCEQVKIRNGRWSRPLINSSIVGYSIMDVYVIFGCVSDWVNDDLPVIIY